MKEPSLEAALKLPALGPTDWQSFFHRSWDFHLPASALNINVAMNGGQVQINRLDINAEPLLVGATGSLLISGALPQGNLFLIAHDFPLHAAVDFFPPLREYQLEGNVQAKASVSGNLQKPIIESASFEAENFKAKIFKSKLRSKKFLFNSSQNFQQLAMRASGAEIRTSSNTFSRLSGNIVLIKKKDLRVKALSFGWDGSVFHLKGRLFPLPKPRIVAVAGSINHLSSDQISDFISQIKSHRDLASPGKENKTIPLAVSWKKKWVKVFKTFIPKKFPNTMGRIHVGEIVQSDFYFKNVDLLWTLKGVTPSLNHINGEAGISLGPGQVKDIETLQSSHKLLKVIFLPYVYMHKMNSLSVLSAAEAYPKTLDFNRIEGEYGISRGIITTRFSYLTGPELVAYASGKADFAKEKIDMSVLTRLTHYRAPLPEWWVDELGRPAIGFRVTGDLNHPSVEPRLSKIKAGEIEGDVELGRKEEKSRLRALQRLNFL